MGANEHRRLVLYVHPMLTYALEDCSRGCSKENRTRGLAIPFLSNVEGRAHVTLPFPSPPPPWTPYTNEDRAQVTSPIPVWTSFNSCEVRRVRSSCETGEWVQPGGTVACWYDPGAPEAAVWFVPEAHTLTQRPMYSKARIQCATIPEH